MRSGTVQITTDTRDLGFREQDLVITPAELKGCIESELGQKIKQITTVNGDSIKATSSCLIDSDDGEVGYEGFGTLNALLGARFKWRFSMVNRDWVFDSELIECAEYRRRQPTPLASPLRSLYCFQPPCYVHPAARLLFILLVVV